MTNFAPSVTLTQILSELRAFLLIVLPAGVEVVKGEINRVPEVHSDDFVVMTPIGISRLSTNADTLDYADSLKDIETSSTVRVQLDVHGPGSFENSTTIVNLFRDEYASDYFATANSAVAPLYADDAHQAPFLNDQQQIEYRWVVDATLQCTSLITVPQDSADQLQATLLPVEATYPVI